MSGPNGATPAGALSSAPTLRELLGQPPAPLPSTTAFDPERASIELLERVYRDELTPPASPTSPTPDRPRATASHGVRASASGRPHVRSQPEPSRSGLAERARGVTKTVNELVDTAREAPLTTGAVVAGTVAFFAAPIWIPAMAGVVAAVGTGLVLLSVGQVAYHETRALLTDSPAERTTSLEESGAAALGVVAGLPAAKGLKSIR